MTSRMIGLLIVVITYLFFLAVIVFGSSDPQLPDIKGPLW